MSKEPQKNKDEAVTGRRNFLKLGLAGAGVAAAAAGILCDRKLEII